MALGRLIRASLIQIVFDPPAHESSPGTPPKTEPMPPPNRRTRNTEVDFKGETRSNAPMPRPRIRRRGFTRRLLAWVLRYASWVEEGQKTLQETVFPMTALMENRCGLIVKAALTLAPSRQIAVQSPAGQWMVMPNGALWCIATPPDRPGD